MIGNISTLEKIIIFLVVGVIVIGAFCIVKKGSDDKNTDKKNDDKETSDNKEIIAVDIPNGAGVIGFHIHHMGMEMEPHYIIKSTEKGVYLKLSNTSPDDWTMMDEDDSDNDGSKEYFKYADIVKDCESGEVVFIEDDTVIKELEDFIVQVGAVGWDGYNEHVSRPGVLDAGDSYDLYMEFSDGETVTVNGYNACPMGFDELRMKVMEIFDRYFEY